LSPPLKGVGQTSGMIAEDFSDFDLVIQNEFRTSPSKRKTKYEQSKNFLEIRTKMMHINKMVDNSAMFQMAHVVTKKVFSLH
jgi:hypothetical protein